MARTNKKTAFVSLMLISLLSGFIWRFEIEYRGWAGLNWISYFHLAIPVGFSLFLLWANFFIKLTILKRVLLNISALIYGLIIYLALGYSLIHLFGAGPRFAFDHLETSPWLWYVKGLSAFIIVPFIPIGTYFLLKIFGKIIPVKILFISIIGLLVSSPMAIVFLELINDKGSSDAIHTIKSGAIIPICLFSIGLLVVAQIDTEKANTSKPSNNLQ